MANANDSQIAEMRADYRAFRAGCGWSVADIADMDAIIKADVAEGPGAERSFDFPRSERLDCWSNWLRGQPAADRLRTDALAMLKKD